MTRGTRLVSLDAQRRRPAVPPGPRADGAKLWAEVTARYDLRVDEQRVLREAAFTADELATITAALIDQPAMVAGPRGRLVPNPLLEEARRHRSVYLRALGQLGLGVAEAAERRDPSERSRAGRALAHERWQGRGG